MLFWFDVVVFWLERWVLGGMVDFGFFFLLMNGLFSVLCICKDVDVGCWVCLVGLCDLFIFGGVLLLLFVCVKWLMRWFVILLFVLFELCDWCLFFMFWVEEWFFCFLDGMMLFLLFVDILLWVELGIGCFCCLVLCFELCCVCFLLGFVLFCSVVGGVLFFVLCFGVVEFVIDVFWVRGGIMFLFVEDRLVGWVIICLLLFYRLLMFRVFLSCWCWNLVFCIKVFNICLLVFSWFWNFFLSLWVFLEVLLVNRLNVCSWLLMVEWILWVFCLVWLGNFLRWVFRFNILDFMVFDVFLVVERIVFKVLVKWFDILLKMLVELMICVCIFENLFLIFLWMRLVFLFNCFLVVVIFLCNWVRWFCSLICVWFEFLDIYIFVFLICDWMFFIWVCKVFFVL